MVENWAWTVKGEPLELTTEERHKKHLKKDEEKTIQGLQWTHLVIFNTQFHLSSLQVWTSVVWVMDQQQHKHK